MMLLTVLIYFVLVGYFDCTHLKLGYSDSGDNSQKSGDDELFHFQIQSPVKLKQYFQKNWEISFNGAIFSKPFYHPFESNWRNFPNLSIIPFWADAEYVGCKRCGVYYRNLQQGDIDIMKKLIKDRTFQPNLDRSFTVTWIAPEYYKRSHINEFQVIVSSDGEKTFVAIVYEKLTYGFARRRNNALAGLKVGNTWCDIARQKPEYLTCRSNTGEPGMFLFEITQDFECADNLYSCSDCTQDILQGNYPTCTAGLKSTLRPTTRSTSQSTTGSSTVQSTNQKTSQSTSQSTTSPNTIAETTTDTRPSSETTGTSTEATTETYTSTKTTSTPTKTTTDTHPSIKTTTDTFPSTTSTPVLDCSVNKSFCEDICNSSVVPNKCECTYGVLSTDQKSCVYDNMIVYTQFGSVWFNEKKMANVSLPDLLTYDNEDKRLFYADLSNKQTIVTMFEFNGKNRKVIFSSDYEQTVGMVYAAETKSIYLATHEGNLYNIFDIDNYPTRFAVIHKLSRGYLFKSLSMDNCARKLFAAFQKNGTNYSEIYSYTMNGNTEASHETIIFSDGIIEDLTVDISKKKLYWIDGTAAVIKSANYDGSCQQILTSFLDQQPYRLTSFSGNLYWTDLNEHKMDNIFSIWKTDMVKGHSMRYKDSQKPFVSLTFINDECPTEEHSDICENPTIDPSRLSNKPLYDSSITERTYINFIGSESSKYIRVSKRFNIFGEDRRIFYININGFITFDKSLGNSPPKNKAYFSIFTHNATSNLPGEVYYVETKNPIVLERAAQELNIDGFEPTHALIITWSNIVAYSMMNKKNTYQAIFLANGTSTHLLTKYYRLESNFSNIGYFDSCERQFNHQPSIQELLKDGLLYLDIEKTSCVTPTEPPVQLPKGNDIELYAYGIENGDSIVERGDDDKFGVIHLKESDGIKLFSNYEEELRIHINGNISTFEPIYGTESTSINIFDKDLATTRETDGNIYYRLTNDSHILKKASEDINSYFQYQNETRKSFNTKNAIVVTYENVREYSKGNLNSFQSVIASNGKQTCVILLYKYLQSVDAKVYLNERLCSKIDIAKYTDKSFYNSTNFNVNGKHVYCVTKNECIWNKEDKNIQHVTVQNEAVKNFKPSNITLSYPNKKLKISHYFHEPILQKNVFQISEIFVNKLLPGISTLTMHKFSIPEEALSLSQFLPITESMLDNKSIEYNEIKLNAFVEEIKCFEKDFKKRFAEPPVMKLSYQSYMDRNENQSTNYNNYVLVWLEGVTKSTFQFCVKELIPFSGIKLIKIQYLAVSKSSTYFLTDALSFSSNATCQNILFPDIIAPPPLIFTTPLTNNDDSEGVFSWVKSVNTRNATICAKSSMDTLAKRNEEILVHTIITKGENPCANFICDGYLECQLDSKYKPYCACPSVEICHDQPYDPVCSYDLISFPNQCLYYISMCKAHGENSYLDHHFMHHGKCKDVLLDYGTVEIHKRNKRQDNCYYVELNSHMFSRDVQLDVQLSLAWNTTNSSHVVQWIEDLNVEGFHVCISNISDDTWNSSKPLYLDWIAYETSNQSKHMFESGLVNIPACTCQPINIKNAHKRTGYFATVQKRNEKDTNIYHAWFMNSTDEALLCVTEVEGKCEGNTHVHWLAIHQEKEFSFTEKKKILFMNVSPHQSICKEVQLSTVLGKLPNPTIVVSPYVDASGNANDLKNDIFSAWIKNIGKHSIEVCVQHNSKSNKKITLSFVIIPTLCPVGWEYNDFKCYYVGENSSFSQSKSSCSSMKSSLVSINTIDESHFVSGLVYPVSTWIGLQNVNGKWQSENGDKYAFTNWIENEKSTKDTCAAVDVETLKWKKSDCSYQYNYICEKDSIFTPEHLDPCNDHVTLDEDWRIFNSKDNGTKSNCDALDLVSKTTWYSFGNRLRILEERCTNGKYKCGTDYPGWLFDDGGLHPSIDEGIVDRELHFYQFFCASDYGKVKIKNCGNYFVYKFERIPFWSCGYGICLERF